ncbi:MAG: T9SS type A sorting domain-containing protein [Candidatus Latescibacterota bacterium]|nr:MAG: T9SS type A sorting domain-containing protein [Candidatus Latescibacterota bacterium]
MLISTIGFADVPKAPAVPGITNLTLSSTSGLDLTYDDLICGYTLTTSIGFTLEKQDHVSLRIYDISGRMIRTVVDGPMGPGSNTKEWDGRNGNGEPVASGIYFYRLTAGKQTLTRKAVLLK